MSEQFHIPPSIGGFQKPQITPEAFIVHGIPGKHLDHEAPLPYMSEEAYSEQWPVQHGLDYEPQPIKPENYKAFGELAAKILEDIASNKPLAFQPPAPIANLVSLDLAPASTPVQEAVVTQPTVTGLTQTLEDRPALASGERVSFAQRLLSALHLTRRSRSEGVDHKRMAASIAERGYARVAPLFSTLVGDSGRLNTFSHIAYGQSPAGEATEHDGLVELRSFLQTTGGEKAKAMLENLTFIGEKEYAEGVAGLASYWKRYLDSDPEAQICVLPGVSKAYGKVKSDQYLVDRILSHFSDDELQGYRGRLLLDLDRLSAAPDKVKVVFIDDWIISGSQMTRAYNYSYTSIPSQYLGRLEVNLLVASEKRISEGLMGVNDAGKPVMPIKSYFLSHKAKGHTSYGNDSYISGTHSSVDFDFGEPLLSLSGYGQFADLPKLARVKRRYGDCLNLARLRAAYSS